MLTWEQSTRNEGKHPPLRACESLELPQLSLSSLFSLSHSLVALRTQSLSKQSWLDMPWCPVAFYFCMSNPLSFLMCSKPFLACCIVVVVKLDMVFCRGNMRSLSTTFHPSLWAVAFLWSTCRPPPALTGRSYPVDRRCCIACFLYRSALLEQTSGG